MGHVEGPKNLTFVSLFFLLLNWVGALQQGPKS